MDGEEIITCYFLTVTLDGLYYYCSTSPASNNYLSLTASASSSPASSRNYSANNATSKASASFSAWAFYWARSIWGTNVGALRERWPAGAAVVAAAAGGLTVCGNHWAYWLLNLMFDWDGDCCAGSVAAT